MKAASLLGILLTLVLINPPRIKAAWWNNEINCVDIMKKSWKSEGKDLPKFIELDRGLKKKAGDECVMKFGDENEVTITKFSYWETLEQARKVYEELKNGEEEAFDFVSKEENGYGGGVMRVKYLNFNPKGERVVEYTYKYAHGVLFFDRCILEYSLINQPKEWQELHGSPGGIYLRGFGALALDTIKRYSNDAELVNLCKTDTQNNTSGVAEDIKKRNIRIAIGGLILGGVIAGIVYWLSKKKKASQNT